MSAQFLLEVLTPERAFFKDMVNAVVLPAFDGELGILAGHEKIVSALVSGILRVSKDGQWRMAATSDGYAMVYGDRVVVLLQSMEWPEEIDAGRARQALTQAEQRLADRQLRHRERILAEAELHRARARLKLLELAGKPA